jgi:hypothetical protein
MEFDLNISNYSLNDVKKLFRLPSEYTRDQVNLKEVKLREQLLTSGHVDRRFQQNLIGFLDDAKRWLIDQLPPNKSYVVTPANLVVAPDPLPNYPHLAPTPADGRAGELVTRQQTPFIYAQPSEYFQGIVNPLDKRVMTRILNVDTRFRQNYNITPSTDFNFTLPEKITKVVAIQLASIEIPITFYNISNRYGNNFFYITARDELSYSEQVFTIPDGNYTPANLLATLNALLSPRDPSDDTVMIDPDSIFSYIQFSYNEVTGYVTLYTLSRVPPILEITMDFTKNAGGQSDNVPVNQKIGFVLGLIQCTYSGGTTYTGESPIYVDTIPYVFLSIDDHNNNVFNGFTSAFTNSVLGSNILARISTANQTGNFTQTLIRDDERVLNVPRNYFGPVDVQRLQVKVYDEYGRVFDLNRRDFSFCLEFKILYDL